MVDITRKIADDTVILTSERGLFWERGRALFIADTHWGGLRMTAHTLEGDLRRLTALLNRFDAQRLIVLGDLLDMRGYENTRLHTTITTWFHDHHPVLPISLVRGEHEREAGDPPLDLKIECVDGPTRGPYFVLCHEPHEPENGYALAGYLHPATVVDGHKVPCYRFGAKCLTLPAFGQGVKHHLFDPAPDDAVIVAEAPSP